MTHLTATILLPIASVVSIAVIVAVIRYLVGKSK